MSLRLFSGLFLFLSCTVQATDPLSDFLHELKSFKADFEQTLYDERGGVLEVSRGIVHLQRPGRFRWEYQTPYVQLIVADGQSIWIHDQDLDQVTIKDFDLSTQNTPALLLSSERPARDFFTLQALPDSADGEQQLKLLPKSSDAAFSSIQLLFKNNDLSRLHVEDKLGQTSVIAFHHPQRNPSLASTLFEFVPPPDADVIDGRE